MNDLLRKECKFLKIFQKISYKEMAEYLAIRPDSFYNWLNGYYNFGEDRQKQLQTFIATVKEI